MKKNKIKASFWRLSTRVFTGCTMDCACTHVDTLWAITTPTKSPGRMPLCTAGSRTVRMVLLLPRGWQSGGWPPVMVLNSPVLKGSSVFSPEGQNSICFCDQFSFLPSLWKGRQRPQSTGASPFSSFHCLEAISISLKAGC